MPPRYHINVFWSEADNEWTADVPDLKSCCAGGATPAEAVEEVLVAMSAWLESATANGLAIPEPQYRPDAAVQAEAA